MADVTTALGTGRQSVVPALWLTTHDDGAAMSPHLSLDLVAQHTEQRLPLDPREVGAADQKPAAMPVTSAQAVKARARDRR